VKLFLLVLVFGLAAACPAPGAPSGKLQVLTSILPVYCLAAQVAGDAAEVQSLLAPGVDAHDFQFTPRERRQFDRADLVVINGLGMEPWLDRLRRSDGAKPILECTAGLELRLIRGGLASHRSQASASPAPGQAEAGAAPNPHVWLDPSLAMAMVTNILVAMQKADPPHAETYAANAAACVTRLRRLDQEIRDGLASLTHRHLVTQHDAFPYFARRYGLTIAGVLEEFPEVAPTAKHLAALKQTIRATGVRALFTEPVHAAKLARQFAADLNLRVAPLDPLETGELTASSYEEGMRRNLRSLQSALR